MRLVAVDQIVQLDPDFGQMAKYIGEHAWSLPHLTMREKAFIFLAADLCSHNLAMPIAVHVRMGMMNGVTMDDFREAVRHLAPYVGYPTAAQALMRLAEIEEAASGETVDSAGVALTAAVPPEAAPAVRVPEWVGAELEALDPHLAAFGLGQFEQRWHRPVLDTRERALATLAVDVITQTLGSPFRAHLDLAWQAGVVEQQVREMIVLVAEFGLAKAWLAFQALDRYLAAEPA